MKWWTATIAMAALLFSGCETMHFIAQPKDYTKQGFAQLDAGQYAQAASFFRQAIAADSTSAESYMGLGETYRARGDDYRAEMFFRKALQMDGSLTEIYGFLGEIYLSADDEAKAIDYFKRCPPEDPHYAELHYRLGSHYIREGDRKRAKEEFELALIHPEFWGGYWGVAYLSYLDNDYRTALARLRDAALRKETPEVLYLMGEVDFAMGADAMAFFYFQRYLAEIPDGPYSSRARERVELLKDSVNSLSGDEQISFVLPRGEQIKVAIYDENGNRIKVLFSGFLTGGKYTMSWDGFDDKGVRLQDGFFFGAFSSEDTTVITRLTPKL